MNRTLAALSLALLSIAGTSTARAQTPAEALKAFWKSATELPDNVWAVSPEEEIQDVVFLGQTRPVVLRLHIQVDGKGFRVAWDDFARKLHEYLDRNNDGTVTKDEAEKGSVLQMIQNGFNGGFDPNARLDIDTSPADGKVTLVELTRFLKSKLGPFQLKPGSPPDARAESMFKRIDRDGDGKLSDADLADAATTLLSADADDDEIIVAGELTPYQNPYYGRRVAVMAQGGKAVADNFPFVAPAPDEAPAAFANLLLKRYDNGGPARKARARDGKLERAEFALEPAAFDRADADGDGKLDLVELSRLRKALPPDLEVIARFSGKSGVSFEASDLAALGRSPHIVASGGEFAITLDGVAITLRANANGNDLRQYYEQQFKASDGDNNKYLEKKETDGRFPFNTLFDAMDRDKDGKLFLEEVVAFVDRQQDASRSRTTVTATDQGPALFETVDADHDGRLSPRELKAAAARLLPLDRDGDGCLALAEVPRHYILVIGRGATGFPFGDDTGVVMQAATRPKTVSAPSWFLKMDRNGDGDVSRREFLGPIAEFDRLDVDHDGLLDVGEIAN